MTENRTLLTVALLGVTTAFGFGWRYRDLPKQDWPWWAHAATAAASSVAATCIGRYAEERRLQR
jgi:hypothetical protein